MRVPDVAGLKNATEDPQATKASSDELNSSNIDTTELGKRRTFGRPTALLDLLNSTPRSVPAPKEEAHRVEERQSSCANGETFYRCANGFTGCCSHDPCNPGQTCSDGKKESDKVSASPTLKEDGKTTAKDLSSTAESGTSQSQPTDTSLDESSLLTASSPGRTEPSSSASDSEERRFAPSCPRADGVRFSDSFNITYNIRCNTDNTNASDEAISVGVGGYAQCFTACSRSESCAGFTFVGLDGGICYLKNKMPKGAYVSKAGRNYVSCAKVDPAASAPSSTPEDAGMESSSKKAPVGAIVGGVLGGVALLAFVIFLIAFLARRKRKKVERKRATIITHINHGPIQTQQPILPTHRRQASTSHDVFAPFGGNASNGSSPRSANTYADRVPAEHTRESGAAAQSLLQAIRIWNDESAPPVPMNTMSSGHLDVERPVSRSSGSRSPRFHEHIDEERIAFPSGPLHLDRTPSTMDSPTLGRPGNLAPKALFADNVRREQHLKSRNEYDSGTAREYLPEEAEAVTTNGLRTPPSARSPGAASQGRGR